MLHKTYVDRHVTCRYVASRKLLIFCFFALLNSTQFVAGQNRRTHRPINNNKHKNIMNLKILYFNVRRLYGRGRGMIAKREDE